MQSTDFAVGETTEKFQFHQLPQLRVDGFQVLGRAIDVEQFLCAVGLFDQGVSE